MQAERREDQSHEGEAGRGGVAYCYFMIEPELLHTDSCIINCFLSMFFMKEHTGLNRSFDNYLYLTWMGISTQAPQT